jgi:class 3 adenylate cyclase/tetratricopeptide (TPR) repeat protein
MAKIFVSYARSTVVQAQLIAETLRAAGHVIWIDDQLMSHRMFSDTIAAELDSADAVVVVWSPDAARSEWVRAEASRARKASKLVQVRFERCPMPMPFDQIHIVDLAGWTGDYDVPAWRSVLASIAAVTGAEAGGASVKAPAVATAAAIADRRSERRQVTALFCDLIDAGALAARLDPEDMMDVLDIYQAVRDDIIAHHGGVIAEATNHGLLAYFGYPRADEDEAANAVRAGIALCAAVARLELPAGVTLQVRVGLATGLVVIADLARSGQGRASGIVGETPTLATRLEAVAPINGVVVSETTRRIAEGLFTWTDLGPTLLPGYAEPVPAFVAMAATDVASRSQARSRNRLTPLFGRETQLAMMQDCWALASEGEGQVVLVQGEAGIGKSRLIEAFRDHVAETPHAQMTWFCAPNYSDSALFPVVDQLSRAAGFADSDSSERRREKLAVLLGSDGEVSASRHGVIAALLGIPADGDDPIAALTPERRKAVTLDTLLAMIERVAGDAPALFIIEDLHWADPTTLELLDRVTRLAADRPWLILGTARPEYESRWFDKADVTHIKLARLDRSDAARICSELGASAILSADTVRQIIDRCDGNPLFVEELTKSVLEGVANASTALGALRVAIPNTLQDSLAARLDRLGPAKQIASLGAAIGRRFPYELLAAVSPQSPADLRQALRELTRADIVERIGVPPKSHYIFKHALIRDAAYGSLLKREREALHGRIALVLREKFPETLAAEPALVAYHLTESGAIAEAVPFWAEAGRRAAAQAAHAEAAAHLQTALDLVRRLPADTARSQQELQLLIGLAASLSASRGYAVPEVGKLLTEAQTICGDLGDGPELFAVLRNITSFYITISDIPSAEATARRCLHISEQTRRPEHQIEAGHAMGVVLTNKGEFLKACQFLEGALAVCRAHIGQQLPYTAVPDGLSLCLSFLPLVRHALGDRIGAEQVSTELVAHIAALDRNFDRVFSLCWHACYDMITGNFERSAASAQDAQAICDETGYDTFDVVAALFKAGAQGLIQGSITGSIPGSPESLDGVVGSITALNRLGVMNMISHHWVLLARLQAAAGQFDLALESVDRAIGHADRFNDRYFLSPAHRQRAEIMAMLPGADPAAVHAALHQAIAIAEAQGAAGFVQDARAVLADMAA